jgi:hypothetical protein
MLQIMDHEKKYFTNNLLGIGFSVAGCALPLMRTALQTIRLPIQIVTQILILALTYGGAGTVVLSDNVC